MLLGVEIKEPSFVLSSFTEKIGHTMYIRGRFKKRSLTSFSKTFWTMYSILLTKDAYFPCYDVSEIRMFLSSTISSMKCLFPFVVYSLSPVWPFCDPMDCSQLGSSVHGILQARILEWVAISFSRGSSWPWDRTWVSCIGRRVLYCWATRETLSFPTFN